MRHGHLPAEARDGGTGDLAEWLAFGWSRPARTTWIEVDGAAIHVRNWSDDDLSKPAMLFVHGFRANSHWWDHIAPRFACTHRVAALDLSGMGCSEWRPSYSAGLHALEILAAADHLGLRDAILVAHSYGGQPALRACRTEPGRFARIILIDSRTSGASARSVGVGPVSRAYPDIEAVVARYRFRPPAGAVHPALVDHLARHAVRRVAGGWVWSFDRALTPAQVTETEADMYRPVEPTSIYIHGVESGIAPSGIAEDIASRLGCAALFSIGGCGHHVPIEAPQTLQGLLGKIVACRS